VAAAIPHIYFVVNELSSLIGENNKVHHTGLHHGYYRTVFEAVANSKKALIQKSAGENDLLFVTETRLPHSGAHGDIHGTHHDHVHGFDPEKIGKLWNLDYVTISGLESKKHKATYIPDVNSLQNISAWLQDKRNLDILKEVELKELDLAENKDKFVEVLDAIGKFNGNGPVVVDIKVLEQLPVLKENEKKEEVNLMNVSRVMQSQAEPLETKKLSFKQSEAPQS